LPVLLLGPAQLVRDYVSSGRMNKQVDFSADDAVLAAAKVGGERC
jgi:hypothetical protein